MKIKKLLTCLVASSVGLSGCASVEQAAMKVKDALPIGTAILGGALCYKFYEGRSKALAAAICAAGGAWLGSKLKQYLSEKEKAQLAEVTYKTLDSGKKEQVVSEEGTAMTAEVLKPAGQVKQVTPKPPPQGSQQTAQQASQEECRTVRQTIVLKSGEKYQEDLTACKRDGKWVPKEA